MRASAVAALLFCLAAASARATPVSDAVARFEAGEYELVVTTLKPLVDGGPSLIADVVERAQALRVYGIACVLTGQPLAAEAAFLLWLRLDPRARLDPSLVRPEVVAFFDDVRARHRVELVREVERRRPRTALLNFFPPAGQYQNRQDVKFGVLLVSELLLLGVNLGTGLALYVTRNSDGTFPNPTRAEQMTYVNWVSFAALAVVLVYGVVDGFVYLARIRGRIDRDTESLRAATPPPRARRPRLAATTDGLALRF